MPEPDCSWCGGDGRVYGVRSGWHDCPYCEGTGVEQPRFRPDGGSDR